MVGFDTLAADHIRWWIVFRFLVVHDVGAASIYALRIVHGARDIVAIFSRDNDTDEMDSWVRQG